MRLFATTQLMQVRGDDDVDPTLAAVSLVLYGTPSHIRLL
jgi:hypothetical protein